MSEDCPASCYQLRTTSFTMKPRFVFAIVTYLKLLTIAQGFQTNNQSAFEFDNSYRRILFGRDVDASGFPFLVQLTVGGGGICGGSIIAEGWVLTAAHCINGIPCSSIKVRPGLWPAGTYFVPIQCFIHERYRHSFHSYDLGLLRLRTDYHHPDLHPIPLPSPGSFFRPGSPAVITGWGQTEAATYPDVLMLADVRVEVAEECRAVFSGLIPKRVLCTLGEGPWAGGTCFGDSGGPVIVNGVLAGISSFVMVDREMCSLGSPSMHVNVADYLPWIYAHIAPDLDTSDIPVQPEY